MRQIEIDGINLEYQRYGSEPAGDTTLLFLHHGLGSVGLWRDFPERMSSSTGLPALAYSRRGYGGSDPIDWPRPLDFMNREASDVIPKLLDKLGIGKVVCFGHSEGASSSLVFAATFPERTTGIVIESAHVYVEECNLAAIRQIQQTYRDTDLRERLARHHGSNVDSAFYGWSESWLQPGFEKWNIERFVGDIQCPVLAIRGTGDEYISTAHFDRIVGLFERPVETLLLDCGHAPHEVYADEILDRATQFIKTL